MRDAEIAHDVWEKRLDVESGRHVSVAAIVPGAATKEQKRDARGSASSAAPRINVTNQTDKERKVVT